MTKQQKQIIFGVWLAFIMSLFVAVSPLHASPNYGFPPVQVKPSDDLVLMHLEYTYGGGATIRCSDPNDCYRKRLDLEARGAATYCNRITVTVNGKVVGWKDYYRWRVE